MKIRSLVLALTLLVFGAATAFAAPPAGQLTPKVSSFDFLVDDSGSMMMTHSKLGKIKMEMAKAVMQRINQEIPNLPYAGSIHTFAPYTEVQAQAPWNRANFETKLAALRTNKEIFARMTPMGVGFGQVAANYAASMKAPSALILFSDGESNMGPEPIAEAKALLAANPGMCLHVVSFADTPAGQATLNGLANLSSCSVSVFGPELLTDDALLQKFVADVFYNVAAAPTARPIPVDPVIVLSTVQFKFDSAELDSTATSLLIEAANQIKKVPGRTVQIAGHTCNVGPEAYNQGLSERRAASVRDFLIRQGIPASSLKAVGYGEDQPKYDNATADGRRMNRRVELGFE